MDAVARTQLKQKEEEEEEEEETVSFAMEITQSIVLPMAMQAAMELGVFEIIAKSAAGPKSELSAAEIAAQVPTRGPDAPVMLDRVLRLLASHRVLNSSFCARSEGRLYSLAPVTKHFIRNQDGVSLCPVMALPHNKVLLDLWFQLKDAIIDGEVPFNRVHGINLSEYVEIDRGFGGVLNRAVFNHDAIVMKRVFESYRGFEHIKQLVDVGGGRGVTLNAIVSRYPHIAGVNFDLPHVIQEASTYRGVEHVGGNMLDKIPKGDVILMKSVISKWDDEDCLRLLRNCYEALPSKGKIIVIDTVFAVMSETVPAKGDTSPIDVLKVLSECPKEKGRSKQQIAALAMAAGFVRVDYACRVLNLCVVVVELIK